MPSKFSHPSYIGWLAASLAEPVPVQLSAAPDVEWNVIRTADRACCCPARPAVVVIVPSGRHRDHSTEILLCVHHFRASASALDAAGYAVLDTYGRLVDTH